MSAPKRPKYSRNPAARAAFIAKRQVIQDRLAQGEFMRDIFEELQLPGSYTQFTRYVATYLPEARPGAGPQVSATRARSPPAAAPAAAPAPSPEASSEPPASPRTAARQNADRPKYDPSKINRHENY